MGTRCDGQTTSVTMLQGQMARCALTAPCGAAPRCLSANPFSAFQLGAELHAGCQQAHPPTDRIGLLAHDSVSDWLPHHSADLGDHVGAFPPHNVLDSFYVRHTQFNLHPVWAIGLRQEA